MRDRIVEFLVYLAVIAIFATAIYGIIYGRSGAAYVSPDGSTIYRVEIDGHDYLKSGNTLTHSASCKACLQREKP